MAEVGRREVTVSAWIDAWVERSRRRQQRTVVACILIVLVLTTLDRPGVAIFAVDVLAVVIAVLWLRARRGTALSRSDTG